MIYRKGVWQIEPKTTDARRGRDRQALIPSRLVFFKSIDWSIWSSWSSVYVYPGLFAMIAWTFVGILQCL